MKQKEFLHIGGSFDGETLRIDEPKHTMERIVFDPIAIAPSEDDFIPTLQESLHQHRREIYILEEISNYHGKGKPDEIWYYRHESITAWQAVQMLFSSYNPSK